MRAAVNTSYGPPEVVKVTDVPVPEPGDGELLIRVAATTVTRTDCAYRAARPFFMRSFTGLRRPRRTILGTEFAGEVVDTGAEVDRFTVADLVFGYCEGRFGAHAEYAVVHQTSSVATIPANLPLTAAAAATEGFHYARAAVLRAGVTPGDDVLVNGATGGIGSAAVQLLAAMGTTVTAACGTEHVDLVRGLGAHHVVDYMREDFTELPEQFDLVFDAVGKSTFGRCRRLLRPDGVYVSSELGPGWQNLPLALVGTVRRGRRRVVFPFPEDNQSVVEEPRSPPGGDVPARDRPHPRPGEHRRGSPLCRVGTQDRQRGDHRAPGLSRAVLQIGSRPRCHRHPYAACMERLAPHRHPTRRSHDRHAPRR